MWVRCLLAALCITQAMFQSNNFRRPCVPRRVTATCNMVRDPNAAFRVTGVIDFTQTNYCGRYSPLKLNVNLRGFPRRRGIIIRRRGLHVHEFGDFSNGCTSFGRHYNPFNMTHGGPFDRRRHFGDFGNVPVRRDGTVNFRHRDRVAKLFGRQSIIGRGVVIHSGRDDLGRGGNAESLITGNSGSRLACCVIEECD